MKNPNFKTENIKKTIITPLMVCKRNCENFIGATQVPLGIAGQLLIKSLKKSYYLPLSTTEGALVASVNRGCKATRLSGGIETFVESIGATRGPLFRVNNLKEARKLTSFVKKNLSLIKAVAKKGEPFIELTKIEPQIIGKNVWLRLFFETNEAMGMNMATIASEKIAQFIKKELAIDCLALSGNLCIDKKPAWSNFITGRGKKVWAEVTIKGKVVSEILKTTPERIVQIVSKKSQLGSLVSGSLGFNAHFANIIAALYLSTGQDMAHVVGGSMGITEAEVEKNGDLYFSVYLPSLMVGTIGGGTGLPTQKEALGILGLQRIKKGNSLIFAQIIGGAVLAGELSLTAALAAKHLAKAHQQLGRSNND